MSRSDTVFSSRSSPAIGKLQVVDSGLVNSGSVASGSVNSGFGRLLALVGMPGCGKSSLAAALARAWGIDFIDSDALVEQRSGMTIGDIFSTKGAAHFRKLEQEVIGELARAWSAQRIAPFVLASGGGAMANVRSRKLLQEHFTTVWLDCPLETIVRRLEAERVKKGAKKRRRPLLDELADIEAGLQSLLNARRNFYATAAKRLAISDEDSQSSLVSRLSRLVPAPRAALKGSTIRLSLSSGSYDILVGAGLLDKASALLQEYAGVGVIVIVVERKLVHYAEVLRLSLQAQGRKALIVSLVVSELQKTLRTAERLCQRLSESGVERESLVVIIGGGVLCDLGAFAASIFMRGVSFALLPTTLLAQVDAAIGGKNGVNSAAGKNMLGSFCHPRLVLCDTDFLSTLSARQMRCGYAEVLKYALIADAPFFAWLEEHGTRLLAGDTIALVYAISHSVRLKARIVEQDEQERCGQRALLNLGHTFGHALERLSYYRVAHGEAVALGCLLAFRLAVAMGRCPASAAEHLAVHLQRCSLPTRLSDLRLSASRIDDLRDCSRWLSAMGNDKKRRGGAFRLVLPSRIGCCALQDPIESKVLATRLTPLLRAI